MEKNGKAGTNKIDPQLYTMLCTLYYDTASLFS